MDWQPVRVRASHLGVLKGSVAELPPQRVGARIAPHAGILLAADPVSRCHAPAASITHPSVRRPVVAWPTRAPVAAHPNMAAASPIPIAREPDVTRCRSHPDYLHA